MPDSGQSSTVRVFVKGPKKTKLENMGKSSQTSLLELKSSQSTVNLAANTSTCTRILQRTIYLIAVFYLRLNNGKLTENRLVAEILITNVPRTHNVIVTAKCPPPSTTTPH